jgi:demethylmenaquinone methyltransferase/2-methoxy-6-polyprenyl-1,4-benzoquinol methylase
MTMNDEATEMFAYYDARADGYDDFYQGRGQAVPELAAEYPVDSAGVSSLLSSFGRGDVLDLACGTGFWLTAYGAQCRSVTLVDQSAAVLTRCQRRVDDLGLRDRAQLIRGDLFELALPDRAYDACLLGFLVSHLPDAQVEALFTRLHRLLRPHAELAVIDSVWSEARRPYRRRDGMEARPLPNGRTFTIRKRYFDRPELEALLAQHGFQSESHYVGNVFIAVRARRNI